MAADPPPISRDEIRESLRPTLVAQLLRSKLKPGSDIQYHVIAVLMHEVPGMTPEVPAAIIRPAATGTGEGQTVTSLAQGD